MNPYSMILSELQGAVEQGDLSAVMCLLRAYESGYTSGYTHTGRGSAYRHFLSQVKECDFKRHLSRIFAEQVKLP
ncbi:MAG TPA: hypothetical protein PKC18_16305 [Lacipirellulaceae bacterium]|nr:hypothetical protein [Lacipirellulaceae bacterium]HMP05415.1 hypothetical protein [Lacipirellulaceae bacterium]